MESANELREKIVKEYPRLGPHDSFCFSCQPGISCFNKCCNDINIFLTPYDIVRLKNRLKISSGEFLEKYTLIPIEENLRHPVVMLRMRDDNMNCPFVDEEKGCTVYEDRPWACRMYPIGVAAPKESEAIAAAEGEFYFLLKEDVCKGFENGKEWTVSEWLDNQNVLEYNVLGDYFKEITLHDKLQKAQAIEPVKLEMFYMVCYDIDKFREFVFGSTFLKRFEVDEYQIEEMKRDDAELLKFGFQWLRFAMYGERTMKLRNEYMNAR
ncbi:MAG: YkgJ family cysteine cluster protein [Bacteroidota bacterium]|nr:YkgJ family cysteine cluster protein [Bacteroidota bacterium]